jgi:hypothetical protein
LNFLDRISKNNQISIFIKMRPVGVELLHEDGLTDITKLIVASRNFANAPTNKTMTEANVINVSSHLSHKHVTAKIV